MPDKPELGGTEDKNKEQKVTLFGILAGTKALLNPIKENLEINKQVLETLQRMDSSLQKMSVSLIAVANNLLTTANVLNDLKNRVH